MADRNHERGEVRMSERQTEPPHQDEDHEAGRTWTLLICSHCGAEAGGGAHGHSDAPDWHWEKVKVAPLSRTSIPSPVSGTEPEDHVTLLVCRRSGVPTQDCPSPHYACENGCDEEEVEYVRVRPVSGTEPDPAYPRGTTSPCTPWPAEGKLGSADASQEPDTAKLVKALQEARNYIAEESPQDDAGFYEDWTQEQLDRIDAALAGFSVDASPEPDTAKGEEVCHRCGGPNRPWAAPSPLWNAVMRGGSINGHDEFDGIVCPTCFVVLAEERGIACGWWVEADTVIAELEMVTSSGRTWDPVARRWADAVNPKAEAGGTT